VLDILCAFLSSYGRAQQHDDAADFFRRPTGACG
jgi:pentatricopeptide repeat protein